MAQSKSSPKTKIKYIELRRKILLTIFYLAWALFGTIASQVVVYSFLSVIVGSDKLKEPFWTLILYIMMYSLMIFIVIFCPSVVLNLYRKSQSEREKPETPVVKELTKDLATTPTDLGVQHLPTFVDIGLAPVAYAIYIVVAGVIIYFMRSFAWFDAQQPQNVGFGHYITGWDRIFAMIALVLIGPIAEELVMRGWLYGKLRDRWPIVVCMILTSLLFGFMHGQWNVAIGTFCLSMLMCGMREITGTIWAGILLHILSNAVAFYQLFI